GMTPETYRGQGEVITESVKDQNGIERDDRSTWAKYTLQNFNKTPLEFQKDQLNQQMQQQILRVMSGEFGAIKGIKLPLYLPLEVTPSELRKTYAEAKEQFKVSKDISYNTMRASFPISTSIEDKRKVQEVMIEARRRVSGGESFDSVLANYVLSELRDRGLEKLPGLAVKVDVATKVASDAELDDIGNFTRAVKVGEFSSLSSLRLTEGGQDFDVLVFLELTSRTETTSREFNDPVVQKQISKVLRDEKLQRNRSRVQDFLVARAVLFPKNLLGG
ncbi:MAG: hypothetical protein KDB07_13540, partial [Planctomycetes bacterium]|nr:hypothetical protein [Planctomycetota bacterium]